MIIECIMNKDISSNNYYNKKLKPFARELRKHSTLSEIILWTEVLKSRKLKGYQFLRQRTVYKYIADFFCKELKLIIELDGFTHESKQFVDKVRQKELEKLGYNVIRFDDAEVMGELGRVRNDLERWIEEYERKNHDMLKTRDRKKKVTLS